MFSIFNRKLRREVEELRQDNTELRNSLAKLGNILLDIQKEIEGDMLMQQVNEALDEAMADMFWVKALDGKYLLANKQIREKLLFDDNPVGKYDVEMAKAQKERVGSENHTFGEICANSDLIVIDREQPMKFNEDGLVNGKYMMLQVHKNVIRNQNGMIIGTVGVGRDITYEHNAIKDAMETTTDRGTKKKLLALLEHYAYADRS